MTQRGIFGGEERQHKRKKLTFRASQSFRIDCSPSKSFYAYARGVNERRHKNAAANDTKSENKGVPENDAKRHFWEKRRQHKRKKLSFRASQSFRIDCSPSKSFYAYARGVNERRHKNAAANDTKSAKLKGVPENDTKRHFWGRGGAAA